MSGHLALGPFLTTLCSHMAPLSAAELRAAVMAYGRELPPHARGALLDAFTCTGAEPEPREPVRALPDDAAALLADVKKGTYVDGWGWDDEVHDERMFGDESWTIIADSLLARAGDALLAGEFTTAEVAYQHLFNALLFDDGEAGCPASCRRPR